MSNIQIINPIDYHGWDSLVLSAEHSSFFHSSAWARVLYESYQYTPLYFTLLDNDKLLSLLPVMEIKSLFTGSRGVSLPFTDFCEPILDQTTQVQDLIDYAVKYGAKAGWKSLELRGARTMDPGIPHSANIYCHTLDCDKSEEEIFSSIRDSTRRNIKKAIRGGVDVNMYHSMDSVKDFYRLNCMTRREHGLPPQPKSFFKKIHDHVISKHMGCVVLASYNGKHIAGGIYFNFGNTAIYKYGASDRTYQHLRANNLVMWEAIKWYAENGYGSFSFGKTQPEHEGLRQFKIGWGSREEIVKYYRYEVSSKTFISYSKNMSPFQEQLFRIIPIPISRFIGSLLYKHVG